MKYIKILSIVFILTLLGYIGAGLVRNTSEKQIGREVSQVIAKKKNYKFKNKKITIDKEVIKDKKNKVKIDQKKVKDYIDSLNELSGLTLEVNGDLTTRIDQMLLDAPEY